MGKNKKSNIIEINGKRYDAHTGAQLDHGRTHIEPAAPVVPKPPVSVKSQDYRSHRTARKAAKSAHRHAPQHSTTLMRKAVRKPTTGLKRRVKAHSHTGALVAQPAAEIMPKLSFGAPNTKRLQRASSVKKSQLITHFHASQPAYIVPVEITKPTVSSPSKPQSRSTRQPAPEISDIFERAIQQATSHLEPAHKKPKKRRLHLTRKHARA